MAWWEWIPIVSTIGHALADPPGRDASDYSACKPSAKDCETKGAAVAILECESCISDLLMKYISDWVGVPIGADLIKALAAGASGLIAQHLTKTGAKFVIGGATTWAGVGWVLIGDAAVDAGIVIKKLMDMYDASAAAKKQYCKCS